MKVKVKDVDLFYEHKASKDARRIKIQKDNKKRKLDKNHNKKGWSTKINRGKINLNLDVEE